MSDEEQSSTPDPEYSPGGLVGDQELVRILLDSTERIITAEDVRRVWGGSVPERDEGEIPE